MKDNKLLLEFRRSDLTTQSKRSRREKQDNKTRYEKRVNSRIANSVQEYNEINMNDLFKNDLLKFKVNVKGETDNYKVTISFPSFLEHLHKYIDMENNTYKLRDIIRALTDAYNQSDMIKINCTCDDYKYRFNYWNRRGKSDSVNKVEVQYDYAPRFDWTNSKNSMGSGCKHCQLVLSNTSCLIKIASVINNYIKYSERNMPRAYEKFIFPALYDKEYEGQLSIPGLGNDIKTDKIKTGKDVLNKANKHTDRDSGGRFTKGNKQGYKFTRTNDDDNIDGQMSLFNDEV